MSETAVVLAGGLGSRLGHYTEDTPKSLLPIGDRPMIEIVIMRLKEAGFTRIVLAVRHFSEAIRAFCMDGSQWGVSIEYVQEKEPLGTIGPIKQIQSLPEDFLILNSDILTDLDLACFFAQHKKSGHLFTVAYFEHQEKCSYGVLKIENQRLVGFEEKPIFHYSVNMGVYVANRKVLELIPANQLYGFDHLIEKLLRQNCSVGAVQHKGMWLDIGSIESYEKAFALELV